MGQWAAIGSSVATIAATTVAHLGLLFPSLYIRRGYAIIRGMQDQSY
jgi:hypothetical protein